MTIRVSYIALLLAVWMGVPATGQPVQSAIRPHAKFALVDIADAKWTSGFWAQRFDACRTSIVPELKPRFELKLLDGIAVLEGKAHMESKVVWDKELYRELRPNASQPIAIRLIRYYAWSNRGPSEMTVWMPLSR